MDTHHEKSSAPLGSATTDTHGVTEVIGTRVFTESGAVAHIATAAAVPLTGGGEASFPMTGTVAEVPAPGTERNLDRPYVVYDTAKQHDVAAPGAGEVTAGMAGMGLAGHHKDIAPASAVESGGPLSAGATEPPSTGVPGMPTRSEQEMYGGHGSPAITSQGQTYGEQPATTEVGGLPTSGGTTEAQDTGLLSGLTSSKPHDISAPSSIGTAGAGAGAGAGLAGLMGASGSPASHPVHPSSAMATSGEEYAGGSGPTSTLPAAEPATGLAGSTGTTTAEEMRGSGLGDVAPVETGAAGLGGTGELGGTGAHKGLGSAGAAGGLGSAGATGGLGSAGAETGVEPGSTGKRGLLGTLKDVLTPGKSRGDTAAGTGTTGTATTTGTGTGTGTGLEGSTGTDTTNTTTGDVGGMTAPETITGGHGSTGAAATEGGILGEHGLGGHGKAGHHETMAPPHSEAGLMSAGTGTGVEKPGLISSAIGKLADKVAGRTGSTGSATAGGSLDDTPGSTTTTTDAIPTGTHLTG